MMTREIFRRRFRELEAKVGDLPLQSNYETSGSHVPKGAWQQWATSAQNLILAVFGEQSPHYTNFVAAFKDCNGYDYEVDVLKGVFFSAKEDFEGGYVFDVDLRVSGEVFGDFITLARQSLSEGYKDVAAVLACAALEDALKRYAAVNGLDINDKTMQEVVNALKSGGFVAGAQKSLLDAMPRIRNFAMHADWDKLSAPDVSSVIGFVEQFLLSKFSQG
jgi:uncharacterized protein DUF4145